MGISLFILTESLFLQWEELELTDNLFRYVDFTSVMQ